jgi:cation diffusion facilitator family transporter
MDTKQAAEVETKHEEARQIQRIAFYGFLLNLGLMVMKAVLAFLSGSLAITASTIDSATDSIASLVLYIGLKLSARKTPAFPLGLYKIENVLSVVIAFFIFFVGYEIARHAFSPAAAPPDISLTVILLISVATLAIFLFGRYAIAAGRRTESPTLIAEGRHRQADGLSSVVVLVSVVISYFELEIEFYGITIDQLAATVVVLFIAHTGWELLSDGMRVLLDASIDHETLDEVRRIVEAEPLVADVQSLVGRNAGRFRFLQATVTVRTDDLQKAHRISENIEANIRSRVPHVERVVIHYEPQSREYLRIALPLSDRGGTLSSHFGESPYFAIVLLRLSDNHIEKQEIFENPYTDIERGKGIRVAEWLVSKKVDEVAIAEEVKHKGPGYVFSDAGVKIHVVSAKDVAEAVATITGKEQSKEERSTSNVER